MARVLTMCAAAVLLAAGCSSDADSAADADTPTTAASEAAVVAEAEAEPTPPELPRDFTWSGRYLVPDLDVDVPFTWTGSDGNFQMVAGGEGETIHFTNVLYDGQLFTLTYVWPELERRPCSPVGPFSIDEFNEGLATASYVGRETLHRDQDHLVDHYRSTAVFELPPGLIPELEGVDLRLPLMAGDIYVDASDNTTFRQVLHFGLQNLYDPNLDEWIVIDDAGSVAGDVSLPDECVAELAGAPAA